jgi:hypothetical protein
MAAMWQKNCMQIVICPTKLIVEILDFISRDLCFIHKHSTTKTSPHCCRNVTLTGWSCSDKACTDNCCSHSSLQTVEWATPVCIDILRVLIPRVSFTASRISSTSRVINFGHSLLATWCAKCPCS